MNDKVLEIIYDKNLTEESLREQVRLDMLDEVKELQDDILVKQEEIEAIKKGVK